MGKFYMKLILSALIIVLSSFSGFTNDLVIDGTPQHSLNPEWVVIGKSLIVFPQSNLSGLDTLNFLIFSSFLFIQKKSPAKLGNYPF